MAAHSDPLVRHFFGGFVRLHVLYHAAREPICGVEMIEELARHGYRLSPGTLYPILHNLQASGYLTCRVRIVATAGGRKLLAAARSKLVELFSEVVEDRDLRAASRNAKLGKSMQR